jgi:hypothetical protein
MVGSYHDVLSSDGMAQLGGDDFDQLLLELALAQAGVPQLTDQERFALLEECREKKEGLHPNTRKIAIDLGRGHDGSGEVIVSTATFYERCRPLVERTMATMERARRGAAQQGRSGGAAAAIYLVGGASALPIVARLLRERYGQQVRKSPYPHAATAIGLAIAADQESGYHLQERFTRHFGVWREAEAGRAVAFDVLFAKDRVLPAPGEGKLTCTRRYRPTHNIGHFRYLECTQVTDMGEPSGDLTPWDEVYFPFVPQWQEAADLQAVPIQRQELDEQWIEERYTCDGYGIIEVEMINHTSRCERRYRLDGRRRQGVLEGG